ncbi:hypothetical protein C8Q74DRAFT_1297755 [Fomes fomentarius]|nr:hypothetical protein C8Q74DRAFT_1297755 [Fomes fomentarius]
MTELTDSDKQTAPGLLHAVPTAHAAPFIPLTSLLSTLAHRRIRLPFHKPRARMRRPHRSAVAERPLRSSGIDLPTRTMSDFRSPRTVTARTNP